MSSHRHRHVPASAMTSTSNPNAISGGGSALIVCDMQPDLLKSISTPPDARDECLTAAKVCLMAARQMKWTVIFTGLRFRCRYEGVPPQHRLYGAFRRLNEKVGDSSAHWFMDGYEGSKIDGCLLPCLPSPAVESSAGDRDAKTCMSTYGGDVEFVWRDRHIPSSELLSILRRRDVSDVTIVGVKASHCVQATAQILCDEGFAVTAVREAIQDDKPERLEAVMTHLLPIYADIVSLESFVQGMLGSEGFDSKNVVGYDVDDTCSRCNIRYLADCQRSGHMHLYSSALLRKGGWRKYPTQLWYSDAALSGRKFLCPIGRPILDFCDEPAFSKISMFMKGREWLDEKEKIVSLAGESMPKTYAIRHGKWANEAPLPEESTLFFLKEAEKNGGKAVQVYRSPAECLANATDTTTTYVVQGHVAAPMLTNDGHKCHVKVYCLLRCSADAGTGSVSWTLYTCKDCYLSVASKVWSPTDVSHDAQITTLRNKRLKPGQAADNFKAWPGVYGKCQTLVSDIVGRAIDQGRLRGREDKAQYEIFSADFILDESDKLWCIEFNFTPVLYDPRANQPLTTRGLKLYDDLYQKYGDETEIDDGKMISDAVELIFNAKMSPPSENSLWDLCATMEGKRMASDACDDETQATVAASFRHMLG